MDRYPLKKYPIIGVCGLECGLCPRYHTEGASRCPGCCGPDFWQKHPACGLITCCVKKKGLETCGQCADWVECDRMVKLLDSAGSHDSFLSHRPIAANLDFIRRSGIEEFARQETEKLELLAYIITNYDDGRSKSFYCTGCQLVPLERLREAVKNVEASMTGDSDKKEKARLVREAISDMADSLQIDLKLRK